jgi:hypothetical protein
MKGFYGYQPSIIEPELEAAFSKASAQLKKCPQVSEVDIGLNIIGQPSDMDMLDQIGQRHGLELHAHSSGIVTVRRRRLEQPASLNGYAVEWRRREFDPKRVKSHLHLPHWNAGFDGLSEGIR